MASFQLSDDACKWDLFLAGGGLALRQPVPFSLGGLKGSTGENQSGDDEKSAKHLLSLLSVAPLPADVAEVGLPAVGAEVRAIVGGNA